MSLHPGHDRPLRPVLRVQHLHLGQAPAPVFLFSSSFAGMVLVGRGLSGLCLFRFFFAGVVPAAVVLLVLLHSMQDFA